MFYKSCSSVVVPDERFWIVSNLAWKGCGAFRGVLSQFVSWPSVEGVFRRMTLDRSLLFRMSLS